jgi:Pro-kumamolisin, activation domain/Subtilase family
MRCLRAALLSFPDLLAPNFLTLDSVKLAMCALFLCSVSFGAVPDRILGPTDSGRNVTLSKSLHPKAKPQYDEGPVDPQTNFSYITLLASPSASQQKALDKLLAEQQDPTSPNYHKWLTPEEYGSQFGLSQNDVNKITKWLASKGFTVISVAAGRNSIVFSGTATQVSAAFQAEIHRYKIGGEEHFANSTPLKIPATWSGVITGVRGLNSFRMKPNGIKKQLHAQYYSSFLKSQFLAPGDIATIYNINQLYNSSPVIDGTGQKLAIIGQTDIYLADINDFRSGFGLPTIPSSGNNSCTLNSKGVVVSCSNATNLGYMVAPGISDPGTPNLCGDLPEADLDLEWSGGIARNAQIIYVNAPASFDSNCNFIGGGSVEDALSAAINSNVAPVVSMSYGICELFAQNDESELQQANGQGITILNSSGDTAAAGCDGFTNSDNNLALGGLAVNYPASSQRVTGVGGTAVPFLDLPPFSGAYFGMNNGANGGTALGPVPEQAWNDVDEFAAFCAAGSNSFCSFYGITSPLTAQEALGIGGGGGGASNCPFKTPQEICQPSWQTVSVAGQASARFVPDISLLASPNFPGYIWCTPVEYLSSTSPYATETSSSCATSIANSVNGIVDASNNFVVFPSIVGGTSVSAPVFAGIVALLNQYVVEKGIQSTPGLGNINPNLYYLAAYDQNAFHQVTAGDSNVYCQPGTPAGQPAALMCPDAGVFGYQASNVDTATGNGYNLVTGLGSVDVFNLASDWVDSTTPVFTLAVPSILTVVNQPITWTGTLTALNGYSTNVSVTCVNAPGTCGSVSFAPSTQKPLSGGVPFQLTVGSSATGFSAPVTYNFEVMGSDGTLAHTHAVSLTVNTDVSVPASLNPPPGVLPGQSTATTMLISPVGSSTFTAPITFTCSGLPAGSTCSFSPPTLPAGSIATTVTVTVQTSGPYTGSAGTALHHRLHSEKQPLWLPFSLPLTGMLLVGLAGCGVPRRYRIVGLCLTLALAGLLVACGGGSSSSPPPSVNVSVSPSTANTLYPSLPLAPAQTQQFTAVVTPTTTGQGVSQNVTWAVRGGSAFGTISSSGLYTAPASLPNPAAVTVTATSPSPGTPGSATVNLLTPTPSAPYSIQVNVIDTTVVRTTFFVMTVMAVSTS